MDKRASVERLSNDSQAWETVFRHPDWAPPPIGHRGRCGHCGAVVGLAEMTCPECAAQWVPNSRKRDAQSLIALLTLATGLSVAVGYGCSQAFTAFYDARLSRGAGNEEFVTFAQSYLWVTCSMLTMLGFTYLAEKLKIALPGHWRTPSSTLAAAPSEDRRGLHRRKPLIFL